VEYRKQGIYQTYRYNIFTQLYTEAGTTEKEEEKIFWNYKNEEKNYKPFIINNFVYLFIYL